MSFKTNGQENLNFQDFLLEAQNNPYSFLNLRHHYIVIFQMSYSISANYYNYYGRSLLLLKINLFVCFQVVLNGTTAANDDRIPPDGQESAALLKHAEHINGNNCPLVGCAGLNNVAAVAVPVATNPSSTFAAPGTGNGTLNRPGNGTGSGTLNGTGNGTLKRINVVTSS